MATFSSLSRQHVLQAIEEYDRRGEDDFLAVYGFVPQGAWTIRHEGRAYDLPAVVGVAHRFATGRIATSDDVGGGLTVAASILRRRGFEVTDPTGAGAPARPAATRAKAPRTPAAPRTPRATTTRRSSAADERPPAICPTCFTALPATGVCDTCS